MRTFKLVALFELVQRMKKRSFWIITFLGPLLYLAMMGIPMLLSMTTIEKKTVHVYDESGYFAPELKGKKFFKTEIAVVPDRETFTKLRRVLRQTPHEVLLHIKPMGSVMEDPVIEVISGKELGQQTLSSLKKELQEILRRKRAAAMHLSPEMLAKLSPTIHIQHAVVTETGTKTAQAGLSFALAMIASMLIYIALSAYGGAVLNSVQEEKQNRLVEVLLLSVRPFQLMLGKIVGMGMVGLIQYFLWAVMIAVISMVGAMVLGISVMDGASAGAMASAGMPMGGAEIQPSQMQQIMEIVHAISEVNWTLIGISFLLYFIGGFFIYAAMFAAVGAAVDDPRDSQMFVFPLILPILLSFISVITTLNISPHSAANFWMSMIPFTSPVAMMARIPFGVEVWEVVVSVSILFITAFFMVWVAGRVFRVGLLAYGSKPSWKTLWKWIMTA